MPDAERNGCVFERHGRLEDVSADSFVGEFDSGVVNIWGGGVCNNVGVVLFFYYQRIKEHLYYGSHGRQFERW